MGINLKVILYMEKKNIYNVQYFFQILLGHQKINGAENRNTEMMKKAFCIQWNRLSCHLEIGNLCIIIV